MTMYIALRYMVCIHAAIHIIGDGQCGGNRSAAKLPNAEGVILKGLFSVEVYIFIEFE